MRKSVKIFLAIIILSAWSYITLLVSTQVKIDRCLDAGGSWDQAQGVCVYIDRESILFYIEQYEENLLDAEKLLKKLTTDLEKQFNLEVSEASLLLHVFNKLNSAESLTPEVLEEVKTLIAEKEE